MCKHLKICICFLLICLISACNSTSNEKGQLIHKDGSITTTIDISAGDMYPEFSDMAIPPFFNIGHITADESTNPIKTLVLSERLGKGKKIDIHPLVLFSFYRDSTHHQFLVSSSDGQLDNKIGEDFNSFIGKNNELQMALENWFKAQCGLGGCTSYEWKNSFKTLRDLQ